MADDPIKGLTSDLTPPINPALSNLEALSGTWKVEMQFPTDPVTTIQTKSIISWHEHGAFLKIHSPGAKPDDPWSTIIVGRDDITGPYTMLYYDWRGMSRIYQMSLENGLWKQWRHASEFSQRFIGDLSPDGNRITARWEISSDGETWNLDFHQNYTKIH